jgi:hypothetical protein
LRSTKHVDLGPTQGLRSTKHVDLGPTHGLRWAKHVDLGPTQGLRWAKYVDLGPTHGLRWAKHVDLGPTHRLRLTTQVDNGRSQRGRGGPVDVLAQKLSPPAQILSHPAGEVASGAAERGLAVGLAGLEWSTGDRESRPCGWIPAHRRPFHAGLDSASAESQRDLAGGRTFFSATAWLRRTRLLDCLEVTGPIVVELIVPQRPRGVDVRIPPEPTRADAPLARFAG